MLLRNVIRWTLAVAITLNLAGCPLDQPPPADVPQTRQEAWRFLTQATFGPSESDINHLMSIGYSAWIDEQLAMTSAMTYRTFFETRDAEIKKASATSFAGPDQVLEAFYTKAVTDPAQLRNRLVQAMSEIFVVSFVDGKVAQAPQMMAGYLDMLDNSVNGTYRQLLESIATSPAMGQYLTFRGNNKEDDSIGRSPDENFAREVMQLFSIGLYQLNPDATLKLDGSGNPIETYTSNDVKGLAKVFTGWGNYRGSAYSSVVEWKCFFLFVECQDNEGWYHPMVAYPNYHSTSAKSFLGVTIPAQGTPDVTGDLRIAMDTLAQHANTAPNISRQLIQRLVTSNPSAAYVQRVADRFTSTGGNIGQVVRAILLDQEARSATAMAAPDQGKLREPVLRLTAILRAFKVRSAGMPDPLSPSGGNTTGIPYVRLNQTSDPGTSLGQSPFFAPSVFNFFRPGYVMPQSSSASLNLVAPEFQIVSETSVTGYVNTIQDLLTVGIGPQGINNNIWTPGVLLDLTEQRAMAYDAGTLIQHIADRLLGGTISATLSQSIKTVLDTMPVPAANADQSNGDAINAALDTRARAAILLVAASSEFLIQR
jgi:uncharacterized protein (DUF1800 family)